MNYPAPKFRLSAIYFVPTEPPKHPPGVIGIKRLLVSVDVFLETATENQ